jgi:hypothetical protein
MHNSFACTYFTSLIAGLGCAGLGGWLHSSIHVWWCTSSPCLVALDLYVAAATASCCRSYPVLSKSSILFHSLSLQLNNTILCEVAKGLKDGSKVSSRLSNGLSAGIVTKL